MRHAHLRDRAQRNSYKQSPPRTRKQSFDPPSSVILEKSSTIHPKPNRPGGQAIRQLTDCNAGSEDRASVIPHSTLLFGHRARQFLCSSVVPKAQVSCREYPDVKGTHLSLRHPPARAKSGELVWENKIRDSLSLRHGLSPRP